MLLWQHATDPSNTKFEMCQLQYKPKRNLLTSRISIKSAVDQMKLKLGMVNTGISSIVQKSFVAIATCLEEINLSAKGLVPTLP